MVIGRCCARGDVQGPRRWKGGSGGLGVRRVHQIKQRGQRLLRRAVIRPHHSLSQTHATPDFLRLMKKVVAAYPGQTRIRE